MQLDFFLRPFFRKKTGADFLTLQSGTVPLLFVRNLKARRYILRLAADGSARVTIPRGGSKDAARDFARRNIPWVESQRQKQIAKPARSTVWGVDSEVFYRGVKTILSVGADGQHLQLADQKILVPEIAGNLRAPIEKHLWKISAPELMARTWELARLHQSPLRRVAVRNQRSRWGSCSARGTVSLNWRLIQTPVLVRDYIILHELMHFREMNHSAKFWKLVEKACPDFATAETWLKQHNDLLR